jgi:hypothetical protein
LNGFIIIRILGFQFFLEDLKVFPILPQKEDKRRNNAPKDNQSEDDSTQVKSGK